MADMSGRTFHIGDLFSCIKRLFCEALRTVDCLDQRKVDSCSLKFNKKLVNGDLIIPAFVRTCLGDVMNDDKAEFERLCQEIIECILTVQLVQHCQLVSGGHLLLTLKKAVVTRAVLHNVMSKGDQYGKSSGENSQDMLLNASVLSSSHDRDHHHLSLDHLRTALICEHTKQLLNANRAEVKSTPGSTDQTVHESELRNNQNIQETCHLFSTSCCSSTKTNMWTEKELDENAKELYKLLKSCKYVQQSHESAVLTDNETSYQIANKIQSDCVCEDTFSCQDSDLNVCGIILDVEEFRKDNKQFEGLRAVGSRSKVILSTSLLKDVAKLDLAGKNAANADMVLHVTSCRRIFIQQQISNVWLMTSTSVLARKQFYLTHGLVSVYNGIDKIQEHLDVMGLQRIREKQLRESYVLKYGDKVKGTGWDISIREMAIAVIKLEILSAAPNNEVKIDLCETSREFRQATFVLYNCARLAKLFQNFEENVHKGIYPALPPVKDVDFNLLRDQAEWELTLNYVVAFPSIVRDAVPTTMTKSQNVTIHTNKICCFLFNLSHKFSSYYGRVHILGESRQHLFPTMFARLYLMKALQQIFLNSLNLLNVRSPTQM